MLNAITSDVSLIFFFFRLNCSINSKWAIFELCHYCIGWAICNCRNFHALSSLTSLSLTGWYRHMYFDEYHCCCLKLNNVHIRLRMIFFFGIQVTIYNKPSLCLTFYGTNLFLSQVFPFSMRDGGEDHETVACCVGWAAQGTISSRTHLNITSLWCGRLYTLKTPLYLTGYSWNIKNSDFYHDLSTEFHFFLYYLNSQAVRMDIFTHMRTLMAKYS